MAGVASSTIAMLNPPNGFVSVMASIVSQVGYPWGVCGWAAGAASTGPERRAGSSRPMTSSRRASSALGVPRMMCCAPASARSPNRSMMRSIDSRPPPPGSTGSMFWSVDRSISSGSRPTSRQCWRRISYLRAIASGDPKTLHASAYWATSRRVFFSPPPPTMIGTRGREMDWGELSRRSAWNWRPWKASSRAALALEHRVADLQGLLEHLEAVRERREREPEGPRLPLVPGRPDPEPRSSAREDIEGRRGLHPQAGRAVVDATDHQPEPRVRRVGRDVAEGRPALEHRVLDLADAADLEEVVHDPDRIEAEVVGLADDPGKRRPDGFRPAGPVERRDLEADLHASRPQNGPLSPTLRK